MLLTKLHETIARLAKTKEELQKLIDVSGSSGIEAVSSDSVRVTDRVVILQNIITAGSLPFKFEASDYDINLKVVMPTLRSLHGMETLAVSNLEITQVNSKRQGPYGQQSVVVNKLTTLKGMPKVDKTLRLSNLPELKSLEGLDLIGGEVEFIMYGCPQILNLEHVNGVSKIQLMECKNISFQHFPKDCTALDIEYLTITRCLPWYITIPPTCKIKHSDSNPFGLGLPPEIFNKLFEYQQEGKSSRVHLLEIQTDLIDADFDHLAEL